ncbi:hypothetical protein EDD17DRAFT_1518000 [Pisolithus thermaeus]|nr:hypothetical protein EDD17DRAFT_1518000 [Pisolithus thermaeus]
MSQQSNTAKPSLQGVKIKARKGAVKAQAKHEPAVFRDQLYKHLETVDSHDFEAITNKLIQAGSSLDFLKYADALFEIILAGGLIQPGGSYVDDGAPLSPFSILQAEYPASVDDLKNYVQVLNKLIRRYKYLQKPLEEQSLPTLLQYINRWSPDQRDKFAVTVGLLISQGIVSATCLQTLAKDHLVKNDTSITVLAIIFRAYLADLSMEHLATSLKRGNIKDLLIFFPPNRRDGKFLDDFFRKENIPQVADWYTKRQQALAKETIVSELKDLCTHEESTDNVRMSRLRHPAYCSQGHVSDNLIRAQQIGGESAARYRAYTMPVAGPHGLHRLEHPHRPDRGSCAARNWGAPSDVMSPSKCCAHDVQRFAPVLEAFSNSPKVEVALINAVQVHCYDDTRIMKAFAPMLKVLYNTDCVSDQAIIYWHQKGSKPQGRQYFLKATEALVKVYSSMLSSLVSLNVSFVTQFLQEQEESEDEE